MYWRGMFTVYIYRWKGYLILRQSLDQHQIQLFNKRGIQRICLLLFLILLTLSKSTVCIFSLPYGKVLSLPDLDLYLRESTVFDIDM